MKTILCWIFCGFIVLQTSAQTLIRIDANSLIKSITPLPPTVEVLHSVYTIQTKYGEEFGLSTLIDPAYLKFKQLICQLHDSTIRAIMKRSPRKDMPDSIQYEDERWKLALRPLLGPDIRNKLAKVDPDVRSIILQVFDMQKIFDWVQYYREDELIKKAFQEKIAGVTVESAFKTAKAKNKLEEQQYQKQQQLWMNRLDKYSQALLSIQQLLEKINYGAGVNATDRPIVKKVLADVLTRALEAHEKLVWLQNNIAISGELAYDGKRIISMYSE
ncbi:MAG: hypothetical protein J7578_18445 [Chitinophagaceae bacterium]|nr:hypothetical protein [Chitinophagaceae bacterium]